MIQILFGIVSDTSDTGLLNNALRTIFSTIDLVIYSLIDIAYAVIFNIADTQFISSGFMNDLIGRIQLVLGLIMIFKITITLIQTVINPDVLTDSKNGVSKIISRILIMLLLLISLIPLNIPESEIKSPTSYNAYLKNSGILFGTMYSLQNRLLSGNVIGKLVLGISEGGKYDGVNNSNNVESSYNITMQDRTESISAHILKSFIKPNLKIGAKGIAEEYDNDDILMCSKKAKVKDGYSAEDYKFMATSGAIGGAGTAGLSAWAAYVATGTIATPGIGTVIGGIIGGIVIGATVLFATDSPDLMELQYQIWASTSDIADIVGLANVTCKNGYGFTYFPIVSSIVGGVLLFMLVGFCIDIAIRAIKLAILQILAPMAIISYVDPKSSNGGAFSNWVKMLTTTYIDLFLRLAIMYFCIFLVTELMANKISLNLGDGPVAVFSFLAIVIGLFYFAKNIPKFVKDALGIKSENGSGFFNGLGLLSVVGGSIGTAATGFRAAKKEERGKAGIALSTLGGFAGGLGAGLNAMANTDKKTFKAVRDAQRQRNIDRVEGGTFLERQKDGFENMFRGQSGEERELAKLESDLERPKRKLSEYNNAFSTLKATKDMIKEEALKRSDIEGTVTLADGRQIKANVAELNARLQNADSNEVVYRTDDGRDVYAGEITTNIIKELGDNQSVVYQGTDDYKNNGTIQTQLRKTNNALRVVNVHWNGKYDEMKDPIGEVGSRIADNEESVNNINRQIGEIKESAVYKRKKYNANRGSK